MNIATNNKKNMLTNYIKPAEYFRILDSSNVLSHCFDKAGAEFIDNWNDISEHRYVIIEHIEILLSEDPEQTVWSYSDIEQAKEIFIFILDAKISGHKTSQMISQSIDHHENEPSADLGSQLRKFYLMVMNSQLFNVEQKFQIIYMELVVPQLFRFNCNDQDSGFDITFSYKTPFIQEKKCKMVTSGRLHECSIVTEHLNTTVSRCNFIMLKIRNEYIVLSGWALFGTFCIQREDKDAEQYVGYQDLMRFHESETFVIGCGDLNQHPEIITFNPKTCVVCMENKCQVRGSCNHATMCESCFDKYCANNIFITCPICRTVFENTGLSLCVNTFHH